ncbi:10276_t:CDS:2, partial [Diversispora eburnea]
MSDEIHEYFNRKSSEWNISDFLGESNEEPFQRKIDRYIKSLDIIVDREEGRRKEKAEYLLQRYREATKTMSGTGDLLGCLMLKGCSPILHGFHWGTDNLLGCLMFKGCSPIWWDRKSGLRLCKLKKTNSQIFFKGDQPDRQDAKRWENVRRSVRSGSTFHFQNPTFKGDSLMGEGAINNFHQPEKRSQEEDQEEDDHKYQAKKTRSGRNVPNYCKFFNEASVSDIRVKENKERKAIQNNQQPENTYDKESKCGSTTSQSDNEAGDHEEHQDYEYYDEYLEEEIPSDMASADTIGSWVLSSGKDVGEELSKYRENIPRTKAYLYPAYFGILDLSGEDTE